MADLMIFTNITPQKNSKKTPFLKCTCSLICLWSYHWQTQMQLKMLWKGYCNTLELMQEHAQMEERFIFPILEEVAKGNAFLRVLC
ncbi:hypothetical protein O6H91_05G033900 [Diphasiastrum complanatum]|uniref:Uncharacterized protein n=1 Tax=Diphasiastrum complanatum TaxID=34168 RepID=A0ACC2DME3_DIPCM|nr:hypothetical protein O6H91_05G033900 [Diphasiastrum complanatum]